MKRISGAFIVLSLLCLLAGHAAASDRISVSRQLVDPATSENTATASDLMATVAVLSNRLFAGSFSVATDPSAGPADYALTMIVSFTPAATSVVLKLSPSSDDAKSVTYAYTGGLTAEVPSLMAHAVFLLWSSLTGGVGVTHQDPPAYVDEIQSSLLSPYATPISLAVLPDGKVVAGLAAASAVLDRAFRVTDRPGASLFDAGITGFAYGVSTTPGGTIVFKPAMGRDAYRIMPGSPVPQKVGLGMETSTASLTALADGSLFLLDASKKIAVRLQGKSRRDVKVFASDWSYITAVAAAPDGSLWFYDPAVRGIRIFTAEGVPVGSFLPLVDPGHPLSPYAMSVAPDGGLIVAAADQIARFAPDGSVLWRLTTLAGAEVENLPNYGGLAVDWQSGMIYLADPVNRRIVKLLDRSIARARGADVSFEEKVIALRSDGHSGAARIAALYEAAGATLMAKSYWQRVLDADPVNAEAQNKLQAIEVGELATAAHELDDKARTTLTQIGIETARTLSIQAIQKYELLLSKDPGNEKERAAMTSLRDLFSAGGLNGNGRVQPLIVSAPTISGLFPALMQWYATHPAGSVSVKNPLTKAVQNVRARLFIPLYMDFPADSRPIATLGPEESVSFSLSPAFNQKVLELQEDMIVQAEVTVAWNAGGAEQTVSRAVGVTVHRNTALTWDDTRKIASFITPNEQTISGFAARVIASGKKENAALSPRIFQALRIVEALSIYGLTYVPDPDTPISRALGSSEVVDTVRFPRTTLYNRTGDCSDTTSLLCSLMESAGIRTAALTSPGHIFMAFDSGEPSESSPYLTDASHDVLIRDGESWIPVETTILSQGFMAAWASATALERSARATGNFEFIPVADMRDSYPALPLPPSTIAVAEPPAASVDAAYVAALSAFESAMYADRLPALRARRATLSGRQAAIAQVQEGVLHALFGREQEAERSFRAAITVEPGLVSPYVNLANLRLLASDDTGALSVLDQGLARNRDSPLLNLAAARIYSSRGDTANTALHLAVVKKTAPELAERFADIAGQAAVAAATGGSGGTQRASDEGEAPALIWGSDQ